MSGPVEQTLVLFLLMAAGFAAGRLRLLEGATRRALSRLLVAFILPCLIVVLIGPAVINVKNILMPTMADSSTQ